MEEKFAGVDFNSSRIEKRFVKTIETLYDRKGDRYELFDEAERSNRLLISIIRKRMTVTSLESSMF